jgi:hypothetical protein
MWRHLMQEKLLFATEHFTLRKLTEDAPFTSVFPSESPGKACNWIGYRIVCSYMNRFKDAKLNDLMLNDNYKAILENSRYNPK